MYNIVYTDDLPQGVGGRCAYPIIPLFGTCTIKIRPKYEDDMGLLNHEIEHYRQYSTNPMHAFMYKYCDIYRYKCELKAYKQQMIAYKYETTKECEWIVKALFLRYNLNYSKHKIEKDIKKVLSELVK